MGLPHARQNLADAIAASPLTQAAFEAAERVLAVAQAQVDGARAALAGFEGLDDAIAAANLAALKGSGADRVQHLASRRRDRVFAAEDLAAAEATLELAHAEMESARVAADERKHAIGSAVAGVLSDHVLAIRVELEKLSRRRHSLMAFLVGLQLTPPGWEFLQPEARAATVGRWIESAGFPAGEAERWSSLIAGVLADLRQEGFPTANGGPAASTPIWKGFAEALLQDPASEAPPLP